jgi:hypothetical protein
MATEEADRFSGHFRSVTVSAIAAIAGVIAALVSAAVTGDMAPVEAAENQTAQLAVVVAVLVQPPLLRVLGLLKDDFGLKDFLYIAFLTFSMWFVSWTILLTTTASA